MMLECSEDLESLIDAGRECLVFRKREESPDFRYGTQRRELKVLSGLRKPFGWAQHPGSFTLDTERMKRPPQQNH